ncbi:unnamed protein product [Strongylus vulgaris]|uniref:Uncharacterized protein n=1 Tax=Strongylus vulgaris TaxID=40348 RepID=A0A3P7IWE3_STRVU|nr:unnamed protein product [Strongylus vulgaris]
MNSCCCLHAEALVAAISFLIIPMHCKAPPEYKVNEYKDGKLQAIGARHLNPKFAVHAEKVLFLPFFIGLLLLSP